jgi:hypothetical protein
MSHMRSKSSAQVGRAGRDVKNQFPTRRGQLCDDPLQAPGSKTLIGERHGLGAELCPHQVIMYTGHTDMLDSCRKEPNNGWGRPERVSARGPGTGQSQKVTIDLDWYAADCRL